MLGLGKAYFPLLCLLCVTLPAVALQGTTTYSICCEDDLECCEGPYTSTGSSESTTRPLSSTNPASLSSSSQNTTSVSPIITSTSASSASDSTSSASISTSSSTSSCTFSASTSTAPCATIDYLHPTQVPTVVDGNQTYDLLGCIKVDLPDNKNPLQAGGTTVKNNLTTAYCASLAMGDNYFGLIYGKCPDGTVSRLQH